jgi:DNA-binding CsgD family transcriptional regulator
VNLPKPKRVAATPKGGASSAYESARAAYESADYSRCLDLLSTFSNADASVVLLRARCAHYLGDDESAHSHAALASRSGGSPGERCTAAVLQAVSAKRLDKGAEARRLFASLSAELTALSPRDGAEARALFAAALAEEADVERARKLLEQNVAAGAHEAQSLALLGSLDMERGAYSAAAANFSKALRRSNATDSNEVRVHATALAALATIAAETADVELAKRVRAAYPKARWPQSVAAEHVAALSALRTLALLDGDTTGAYFLAREATAVASTPARSALAETHLAAIARILGDLGIERLQLGRAWDILRAARGLENDRSTAHAFAQFAIDAAAVMPVEARRAMSAYRTMTKGGAIDSYLEALAATGAARVAEAGGDRVGAVRSERQALATWQRLGLELRAALVALDLRRLTGDESFVKIARSVTARAPKAWFAADLKRNKNPIFQLTPAERVVLARLLRGESAKAIGDALERSPFTISNHTRKIFAAFDLNSRSKVIARCVELGITPESIERAS